MAFVIRLVLRAEIFCRGRVNIFWGIKAVQTLGRGIVFRPNYLPEKHAIAMVCIFGFYVCRASQN